MADPVIGICTGWLFFFGLIFTGMGVWVGWAMLALVPVYAIVTVLL